ncbi:hypothetical protein HWV62_1094 [Athelia sp. TMB]|nr:hypothetical protein HWV62_1094 [Athelia sp. TMB]
MSGAHIVTIRLMDWQGIASAMGVDYVGVDQELLAAAGGSVFSSFISSSTSTSPATSSTTTSTVSAIPSATTSASGVGMSYMAPTRNMRTTVIACAVGVGAILLLVSAYALFRCHRRRSRSHCPSRKDFDFGPQPFKSERNRDLEDGEMPAAEEDSGEWRVSAFPAPALPISSGPASSAFEFDPRVGAVGDGNEPRRPRIMIMTTTETQSRTDTRSPSATSPQSASVTSPSTASPRSARSPRKAPRSPNHPRVALDPLKEQEKTLRTLPALGYPYAHAGPRTMSASAKVNARVMQWMTGAGIAVGAGNARPQSPAQAPETRVATPMTANGDEEVDDSPPQYEWVAI